MASDDAGAHRPIGVFAPSAPRFSVTSLPVGAPRVTPVKYEVSRPGVSAHRALACTRQCKSPALDWHERNRSSIHPAAGSVTPRATSAWTLSGIVDEFAVLATPCRGGAVDPGITGGGPHRNACLTAEMPSARPTLSPPSMFPLPSA